MWISELTGIGDICDTGALFKRLSKKLRLWFLHLYVTMLYDFLSILHIYVKLKSQISESISLHVNNWDSVVFEK